MGTHGQPLIALEGWRKGSTYQHRENTWIWSKWMGLKKGHAQCFLKQD